MFFYVFVASQQSFFASDNSIIQLLTNKTNSEFEFEVIKFGANMIAQSFGGTWLRLEGGVVQRYGLMGVEGDSKWGPQLLGNPKGGLLLVGNVALHSN